MVVWNLSMLCLHSLASDQKALQESEPAHENAAATEEKGMEWLQSWYDKIMESGGKVTQDAWNWVNEDWKKRGAWEYKVLVWNEKEEISLEDKLNELGQQRWECFWVGDDKGTLRMFFKRPKYSFLRSMPANDLLRFIPQKQGNGAE